MRIRIADIRINTRFRPLREGEVGRLASSIEAVGLLNPITVTENYDLIAGHHRLKACEFLGWPTIEANVVGLDGLDAQLAEIDENLIRSELTAFEEAEHLHRRKQIYEHLYPDSRHGYGPGRGKKKSGQDVHSFSEDTAEKTGQSARNVRRKTKRIESIPEDLHESLRKMSKNPETAPTGKDLDRLSSVDEETQREAVGRVVDGEANTISEGLSQLREEEAERLKSQKVIAPGKYQCIVIDPPWEMAKIERDERPIQHDFNYPTMSEEDLADFPLPDFAADDCHLYLWTTHKHLPAALRLCGAWGFRYQCLMTWVKNVGFTPFSWMYSTELVLFCRRGSLKLDRLGLRLDFAAKVREHSRKPDEFYALVAEASPGPRIDIFSREPREGFDQYGNEASKFESGA